MNYIIVDTGFFIALFNQKDQLHERAKSAVEKYSNKEWISSVFTVQETFWLLSKKGSRDMAEGFLTFADEDIYFPVLPNDWLSKIKKILNKYRSAKIDLADASLVILAECTFTCDILSADQKDFDILRWGSQNNTFNNLLFTN